MLSPRTITASGSIYNISRTSLNAKSPRAEQAKSETSADFIGDRCVISTIARFRGFVLAAQPNSGNSLITAPTKSFTWLTDSSISFCSSAFSVKVMIRSTPPEPSSAGTPTK